MFVLGRAARDADVTRVNTLLREGVKVNSRDSEGRTALHYACESEDKDMQRVVDVLLDAGAEVNAQDDDGETPLHVAVQSISNQTKLEKSAAGGKDEETPLAISSKRNEVLVKTLLREGVQVNSRDSCGRTALHYACESEHEDMQRVVDVLLDAGAEVNAQDEDGETPLHVAVQRISFQTKLEKNAAGGKNEETPMAISSKRNEVLVKTLLRDGVQVNSRDSRGRTALHYACESEHEDMQRVVDVLLDAGAKVNAQDEDGQTPLHVAVQRIPFQTKLENNAAGGENEETPLAISSKRKEVLVKTLLRKGALVNVRDRKWRTALHCACTYQRRVIKDELREAEAKTNIQDEKGQAPLHVAIDNNKIIKTLLAHSETENSKNWSYKSQKHTRETALQMAARYGRTDIVDILLNNGEDINAKNERGNTLLHMVSDLDQTETVSSLLSKGAKVGVKNKNGETALHMAARYGRADNVDILLNSGEDVNATNKYGETPLHVASEKGRTETIRLLYRKGAKVGVKNNNGETALQTAARYGRAHIIDILLNNGEDVNATNKDGNTLLHMVSDWDQTETLRLLLSKGAKVGVQNNDGETALQMAASFGRVYIVNILLYYGEDVNATNKDGDTLLHVASKGGRTETVRLLLSAGAKVGVQNNFGQTALHMATCYSGADIVDILLNNGEDINATDNWGNTPLHVASEGVKKGQTETVRLLLSKGAKVGVKTALGETPLHRAAIFAAGDIVDVLVDHGEYVNAEDINGNTPLHHLCEKAVMDNNQSQSNLSKPVIVFINLLIIRGAKIDQRNIHGENPHEKIKASRDYRMKDVETTLIKQVIRLKTLGVQDKFDINWIFGPDLYDKVKIWCCWELERMKYTMVVKEISLYQVLSHISQSFLVSTEDLQHIDDFVSSPDLVARFPHYGDTLRITFQRAKLLTLAVQSFYSERRKQMMKKLPCEVAEQLVNSLSNNDLRMFIESE